DGAGAFVTAPWGLSGGMRPTRNMDINQMHHQLGHCNEAMVRRYAKECGVHLTGEWQHYCKGCAIGKAHRKPVPKVTSGRSEKRLGRVFIDLSGPKPKVSSPGGFLYEMLMVCDKTGMGWLRFLKSKDEAAKVFRGSSGT
ncbi:unnamed protein product, partial [Choristocarpus tenellus]